MQFVDVVSISIIHVFFNFFILPERNGPYVHFFKKEIFILSFSAKIFFLKWMLIFNFLGIQIDIASQNSALFRFSNTVVRRFYGLRKCGSFDRSVQASVLLLPHLQIIISSGAKVKLKGCNGHLTKAAYFCGSWEKFAILNFYVDNNDWGINTK